MNGELMTRRTYLVLALIANDSGPRSIADLLMAKEAVASTAMAHPEWDMDEKRTWDEWAAQS